MNEFDDLNLKLSFILSILVFMSNSNVILD